jgi:hypothetical protein
MLQAGLSEAGYSSVPAAWIDTAGHANHASVANDRITVGLETRIVYSPIFF